MTDKFTFLLEIIGEASKEEDYQSYTQVIRASSNSLKLVSFIRDLPKGKRPGDDKEYSKYEDLLVIDYTISAVKTLDEAL